MPLSAHGQCSRRGRAWTPAARPRAPRAAARPARGARAACRGSPPRRRPGGTRGTRTRRPTAPAKMKPSCAAAFVSAGSDAGVRTISSPLPSTSSSTWLVTVTGNASLPSRPSAPSSWRKSSSARSSGISRACSSTRYRRSAPRSKTTPRSAPSAATSRFVCSIESPRSVAPHATALGDERVRGDRLDAERPEHERQHERRRGVAVVDDDPEVPRADRLDVERARAGRSRSSRHARRVRDRRRPRRSGDAPELLRVKCFSISFCSRRRERDPRPLEELDPHHLGVGRRCADVDAGRRSPPSSAGAGSRRRERRAGRRR